MYTRLLLRGLLLLGVATFAGTAFGQAGYGLPYAIWAYDSYPGTYLTDAPPYFAIHPPVYYSARIPRTYGYSPFPYPPYILTPGSESPWPRVIQNVYGGGGNEASESPEGRQPLRIDNPYVEQSGRSGVTKTHKSSVRQPQIVYPAALAVSRG